MRAGRGKLLLSSPLAATYFLPVAELALFLASFAVEATGHLMAGRLLRAVCVSWIALWYWRIHRRPKARGGLAFWVRWSAWMLLIGCFAQALLPSYEIHAAHLVFVAGLGLMTLLVGSRVVLAHGGFPEKAESSSRIFHVFGGLILLAAVTRFIAPFTHSYTNHLAYAALVWILGLASWTVFFVPKMLKAG